MEVILLLVALLSCGAWGLWNGAENNEHHEIIQCTERKQIKSIGGCNAFGDCGVRYSDGTTGRENYPVVGHYACTKREWFPSQK